MKLNENPIFCIGKSFDGRGEERVHFRGRYISASNENTVGGQTPLQSLTECLLSSGEKALLISNKIRIPIHRIKLTLFSDMQLMWPWRRLVRWKMKFQMFEQNGWVMLMIMALAWRKFVVCLKLFTTRKGRFRRICF